MLWLTIIVFILVLGLLIFVHELGHFIFAKRAGMKVSEFGFGFPPKIFGKKYKGTIYSINLIPLGGFVKIYGEDGEGVKKKDSFASRPAWERFKVLSSGVFFNLLLAILFFAIYFWAHGPTIVSPPTDYTAKSKTESQSIVWQVEAGTPAGKAGIERGDILEQINGQNINDFSVVEGVVKNNPGGQITLEVKRDNQELNFNVTLANKDGKGLLGISAIDNYISAVYPWWKVPYIAVIETFKILWLVLTVLYIYLKDLIVHSRAPQDLAGPVGIFVLTGEVIKLGFREVIRFVALLSLNLAIINFLPLPALDGGRVLFLLIEKVRGKKVTPKIEGLVHSIGFALLIALIVLITYRDVLKFVLKR